MNRVNWIIMRFENIYIHNYHFKTKQLLLWAFQGLINMMIQFNTHLINRWLAVCGKTKHTNNMKRKKGTFFCDIFPFREYRWGIFVLRGETNSDSRTPQNTTTRLTRLRSLRSHCQLWCMIGKLPHHWLLNWLSFLLQSFWKPPPQNPASGLILNYCLLQLHPFLGTETL